MLQPGDGDAALPRHGVEEVELPAFLEHRGVPQLSYPPRRRPDIRRVRRPQPPRGRRRAKPSSRRRSRGSTSRSAFVPRPRGRPARRCGGTASGQGGACPGSGRCTGRWANGARQPDVLPTVMGEVEVVLAQPLRQPPGRADERGAVYVLADGEIKARMNDRISAEPRTFEHRCEPFLPARSCAFKRAALAASEGGRCPLGRGLPGLPCFPLPGGDPLTPLFPEPPVRPRRLPGVFLRPPLESPRRPLRS